MCSVHNVCSRLHPTPTHFSTLNSSFWWQIFVDFRLLLRNVHRRPLRTSDDWLVVCYTLFGASGHKSSKASVSISSRARYSSEKHSSTEYDDFFLCFFFFCCCSSWCHEIMLAGESLKERKERKNCWAWTCQHTVNWTGWAASREVRCGREKKSINSLSSTRNQLELILPRKICVCVRAKKMEIHFNIYLIPFTYKFACSHIDSVER